MENKEIDIGELVTLSNKSNQLRKEILEMIFDKQSGHPGGSFSCLDILVILYSKILNIHPQNPNWERRDRFILSKGHGAPALYSILGERGFFKKERLREFRGNGTFLKGHPSVISTPGIDAGSGSLGMGLSIGIGQALAAKSDELDYKVYVLLGDGELNEGQVWEAAMAAAHFKLDNLIVIIDCNKLQLDGATEEVMRNDNLVEKWDSFGFDVSEVDGHNYLELLLEFTKPKNITKPRCIIAHTIKGKGVSFMENNKDWHSMRVTTNIQDILNKSIEELSLKVEV